MNDLYLCLDWIEKNELIEDYNNYTIKRYGKKQYNAGEMLTSVKAFTIKTWEEKNPVLAGLLQKECLNYSHYLDEVMEAIENELSNEP